MGWCLWLTFLIKSLGWQFQCLSPWDQAWILVPQNQLSAMDLGWAHCRSGSPSLVLGWAPGFMELTWCWGGLGAWVYDSWPSIGPGWEPGLIGAWVHRGQFGAWSCRFQPSAGMGGILGLQEPTRNLAPQEPPGVGGAERPCWGLQWSWVLTLLPSNREDVLFPWWAAWV